VSVRPGVKALRDIVGRGRPGALDPVRRWRQLARQSPALHEELRLNRRGFTVKHPAFCIPRK
jgi:hypothetical protein